MRVCWSYSSSATCDGGMQSYPRGMILNLILAQVRNQEWESKAIQKLLETHNQKMIKVRKETKEEIGETTRGLIKEFRQVKQTIEKM